MALAERMAPEVGQVRLLAVDLPATAALAVAQRWATAPEPEPVGEEAQPRHSQP